MLSKPLNPSIKLEPLIINKKHKEIKISEKICLLASRFILTLIYSVLVRIIIFSFKSCFDFKNKTF